MAALTKEKAREALIIAGAFNLADKESRRAVRQLLAKKQISELNSRMVIRLLTTVPVIRGTGNERH